MCECSLPSLWHHRVCPLLPTWPRAPGRWRGLHQAWYLHLVTWPNHALQSFIHRGRRCPAVTGPPCTFHCYPLPQTYPHYHNKELRHFERALTLSSAPLPSWQSQAKQPFHQKREQSFCFKLNLFQQLIIGAFSLLLLRHIHNRGDKWIRGAVLLVMPPDYIVILYSFSYSVQVAQKSNDTASPVPDPDI